MTTAEITGGPFFEALGKCIFETEPETIVEVGASNGLGSTMALIAGRKLLGKGIIHCIEMAIDRCCEFRVNHQDKGWVILHQGCAMDATAYPSEHDLELFWKEHAELNCTKINLSHVYGWRCSELELIHSGGPMVNFLPQVMSHLSKENTFCLLDGSAFTGEREAEACLGARVIALDDTMDLKHWKSLKLLEKDSRYKEYFRDDKSRNGNAIYVRK